MLKASISGIIYELHQVKLKDGQEGSAARTSIGLITETFFLLIMWIFDTVLSSDTDSFPLEKNKESQMCDYTFSLTKQLNLSKIEEK